MRRSLAFLLIVIFSCAAAHALQTLSVTGTGLVQVAPDTADVKLEVDVLRKTAQEAQAGNAEIMQKVVGTLIKLNIPKDKIQTSGFNLWPEMKYEPNQPSRIAGYRCRNQVIVTVEDLSRISRIIDAGIGAGAGNVQGLQFSRRDDLEFKKQALDKAVKEASAKAQAIAGAAGLKIKAVVSIAEKGVAVIQPVQNEFAVRAMAAGGAETPVSPGLIEIRGNVTIVYKVE